MNHNGCVNKSPGLIPRLAQSAGLSDDGQKGQLEGAKEILNFPDFVSNERLEFTGASMYPT